MKEHIEGTNLLYELNPSTVNMRANLKILDILEKQERRKTFELKQANEIIDWGLLPTKIINLFKKEGFNIYFENDCYNVKGYKFVALNIDEAKLHLKNLKKLNI